ncbi:sterol 26-hydroxylase, mitochondrial-like [Actinia tenebrosa]|uniref:Cholesterol side-chain cleavage enzyme, mitochondrial n=1 Tax=Actinia tenebrosa TaxID=6105 RepID=A0A6P8I8V3_ACTTE|nr:sterol 26-hydroxylase, mitochondrial-like [Actinia tenebrosa]
MAFIYRPTSLLPRLRNFTLARPACAALKTSVRLQATNTTTASEDQVKSYNEIPGSGTLKSLYNFLLKDGISRMHLTQQESRDKHGPICREILGPHKTVYVFDPDVVQQVFRNEGEYPAREPSSPIWQMYKKDRAHSEGVLTLHGEDWYKARSALSKKMLKPKVVSEYAPELTGVMQDFVGRVMELRESSQDKTVPNLQNELFKWSLESIGTVLFEKRFGSFEKPPSKEAQHFINAVQTVFSSFLKLLLYPEWMAKMYKTKRLRAFYDAMDVMYDFGDALVQEKMIEIAENAREIDEDKGAEFLTFIVASKKLSSKEITANLVEILMAAVDTTSNTSLWTMYNLARNPEVQERLHKEVTSVLKPGEIATPSTINKMHYLKACIKETLRLFPAAIENARIFDRDVPIMGYNIPKNAMVRIPIYAMGRDANLFDDPLSYKPERWLRGDKSHPDYHPFSSLPFGYGVRMCLGRRVAEMEMYLLFSRIMQLFQLESMNDVKPVTRGVLAPDKDVLIKFNKR